MNDVRLRARATASPPVSGVRRRLLMSGFFLLVQVAATDYGVGADTGAAVLWFAVGAGLLLLVYRRSRVARAVVVIGALFGAIIYALGAFENVRAAVLALAYVGQALPLLTGPIRRHVQTRTRREDAHADLG
jgi:hypothetical protein